MEEKLVTAQRLAQLLREAEEAHAAFEKELGRRDDDWPDWYARWILERLPAAGTGPEEMPRH
jgi:hypothetical protein